MKPFIILDDAEIEMNTSAQYYNRQVEDLGFGFLAEIEKAFNEIQTHPHRWPVIEGSIHKFVMIKFPFTVFYIDEPTATIIIAIAHQKRKAFYWKDRIS